jgi:hypothetical protein
MCTACLVEMIVSHGNVSFASHAPLVLTEDRTVVLVSALCDLPWSCACVLSEVEILNAQRGPVSGPVRALCPVRG